MAVALRYAPDREDGAPLPEVTAGGEGAVAERILRLAFDNGVRVREDPDLAEMLSAVDVGSTIPVEAFAAVAEVLAYVYRANRQEPPLPFGSDAGVTP